MKHKIILLLLLSGAFLIFTQSAPPPPPSDKELIASYEQNPPVPLHYWVQLLDDSLEDGSNMIMRIEYEEGVDMPESLNIYYNADNAVTFHDDGAYPDSAAGDRIYAAYVQEDTAAFESQIKTLEAQMYSDSTLVHYYGHAAKTINTNTILSFDNNGFHGHHQVEVYVNILDVSLCKSAILKQNSLFITDLSVVEDPARTFNVADGPHGSGNPVGVWTFGNLIKNIANEAVTGVSAKQLLKNWLRRWTKINTINGQTIPRRTGVYQFLIGPWLQKCKPSLGLNYYIGLEGNGNGDGWEGDWDAIDESVLLKFAPFKLMAIVNRMDLKGNSAYSKNISNAGETRFIYTLEAPFELTTGGGVITPAGYPPRGADGAGGTNGGTCIDPIDWEGMNVIIEYGNPFTNACELWLYQKSWYDLSGYALNTPEYNAALEAITHKVIDANVAPNKPNKSALDQIRTNERIFFPTGCGLNGNGTAAWSASDWELSQFELDASDHLLHPAPVSNTPMNQSNVPWYLDLQNNAVNASTGGTKYSIYYFLGIGNWVDPQDYIGSTALLEWTFANKYIVRQGKHSMPTSFDYSYSFNVNGSNVNGTDQFKLAATAVLDAEQVHYWDLPWYNSPTDHYYNTFSTPGNNEIVKDVRQQLSLNTCHGCHSGETKTTFTMVRPLPYGQSANYWGDAPNDPDGKFPVDKRTLDTRFMVTKGQSKLNDPNVIVNNHVLPAVLEEQYYTRVSPFITGRNFSGNGTFEDDKTNPQDGNDDKITGLFYVYDPANYVDNNNDYTYPGPQRFNKYNDLQRRNDLLCNFLNTDCSGNYLSINDRNSVVLSILHHTVFMPLPRNGH